MISIDGIFLFKLYALVTTYELFIQKHLVPEIQNSSINTFYKYNLYKACSVIAGGETVIELIEFCKNILETFFCSRKLVFRNKKFTAQVFNYTTLRDNESGFKIKKFIQFLGNRAENTNVNASVDCFRQEIINLLENVLQIRAQSKRKNLIITFNDWKVYRNIFKYIAMQYEYICNNDNKYNLYAYETCYKTLDFNIELK